MTDHSSPENAIAREIDDALDAFLYAKPEEKSKARAKVHAVLWENKAGIVAGLRIHAQCAPDGFVLVPQTALDWLDGSAPDPDGRWFGDHEDVHNQTPSKFYRKYWWRSKFRELCAFTSPGCGEVDPTRPACGQGDEHGRKPTEKGYGHD